LSAESVGLEVYIEENDAPVWWLGGLKAPENLLCLMWITFMGF